MGYTHTFCRDMVSAGKSQNNNNSGNNTSDDVVFECSNITVEEPTTEVEENLADPTVYAAPRQEEAPVEKTEEPVTPETPAYKAAEQAVETIKKVKKSRTTRKTTKKSSK